MNVLEQEKSVVTHLVDICKDGRGFYRSAAEKVENEELENICTDNANTRDAIIVNLQDYLKKQGVSAESGGTVAGKAAEIYGHLAAMVTPDTNQAFVTQLEEAEDRSLEEFRKAMDENITPALKEEIGKHLEALQHTHDRMKALKDALKAA